MLFLSFGLSGCFPWEYCAFISTSYLCSVTLVKIANHHKTFLTCQYQTKNAKWQMNYNDKNHWLFISGTNRFFKWTCYLFLVLFTNLFFILIIFLSKLLFNSHFQFLFEWWAVVIIDDLCFLFMLLVSRVVRNGMMLGNNQK